MKNIFRCYQDRCRELISSFYWVIYYLGVAIKKPCRNSTRLNSSAEAGGFEPPVRLPVRQFSKLVVSATHPNFLPSKEKRFLADSNRRTRFCRPLTKPLIQGTKIACFRCFSIAVAKVRLFFEPASVY